MENTIDVSRDAQLRDIEVSFAAVESSDLASLRHPTKPELTAVEVFDILPDADIWANAYDLFRFSERPGDRPPEVSACSGLLSNIIMTLRSLMTLAWIVLSCDPWRQMGITS